MTFENNVIESTINRLLKGEDYREEVVKSINAVFLDFTINFFKKIVEAKMGDKGITLDWYKKYFISGDNSSADELVKVKHRGKIFTPDYLVDDILNQGHYQIGNINKKHVIDNSCGDGQFMIQIVKRYCEDFKSKSNNLNQLKLELETYIHAIEIESEELEICKERCEKVANMYGVNNVVWDFINSDTLKTHCYDKKMDFVLGNPPYVRVHNLKEDFSSVKSYAFGNGGMTDLYIVFYEVGISMLNENGILCYITPSSFFTSLAGKTMRNYYVSNNLLESICDLKHFQPFNAITYTTIVCLNKKKVSDTVKYFEFDKDDLKQVLISELSPSDFVINDNFYFSTVQNLNIIKKILNNSNHVDVFVKNGFATLADTIFIGDFDFDSKYIIPVIKASRAKWTKIIYPYGQNNKLITEVELCKSSDLYNYLLSKKTELTKRSNEKDKSEYWYAFGRSQAINDTYKDKVSINALIRVSSDLKLIDVPAGCGVYSGLYIISDSISLEKIKKALYDEEFGTYISLLGKYKSGGYYTFSSKDVKFYLDYKLGSEEK